MKTLIIDADSLIYKDGSRDVLNDAKLSLVERINHMLDVNETDKFALSLSHSVNFRKKIDVNYKANRKDVPKPQWFNELTELLMTIGAFKIYGLEADDVVSIIHMESKIDTMICSTDKDVLRQVPGVHFDYNYRKNKETGDTIKGNIVETSQEDAEKFLLEQTITGDSVDNIIGIKGVGPAKAKKILALGNEHALDVYINNFGIIEGMKRFNNNYQLVYIKRSLSELPFGTMEFEFSEIPIIKRVKSDNVYGCVFEKDYSLSLLSEDSTNDITT